MSKIYTTKRDAIEAEILPALAPDAESFDVEAIADEVCAWQSGGYIVEEGPEFWAAVERHAVVDDSPTDDIDNLSTR